MGLTQTSVALLALLTLGACTDVSDEKGDLEAVESRYKVVAKPEPYQPPRPAPDDYEITTRRGIDGAEIIYPTTTYRPVDLYLPTKGSEKFLLNFKKSNNKNKNYNDDEEEDNNETEENLESLEIITKEKSASSGGKKRIKKVRKVLRNSAARSLSLSTRNSTSNRFSEKEKHPEPRTEVKSLLPTIKPTHRTTTTTTTPRPHRQQQQQQQHQQRNEASTKPAEVEKLFQHSGDIDIRTNKKARGLAVLSQLSGRPHALPPPPQPVIPAFLPAPANLPPRAILPTASLAPLPTTANEIFGSSDVLVDDTDYQFDADYETYKARPYAFTYGVKDDYSGTDFSRAEESSGQVTKGQYQVALPDGRIQIVSYVADINGFKATVSYEGEAVYPEPGQYGSYVQPPVQPEPIHVVAPVTPEPHVASLSPRFVHPEPVPVAAPVLPPAPVIVEDEPYYDNDYYADEPLPLVKSLAPSPPPQFFPAEVPSPSPSPSYASPTPKSFLPTYPHFEPLYHQDSPPPTTPGTPIYDSTTPVYQPPAVYSTSTPLYESPSPSYSPSTPLYESPSPSYSPSTPLYESPSPSYSPSTPLYVSPTPSPTYGPSTPSPTYGPPTPHYASPSPLYEPASPVYEPTPVVLPSNYESRLVTPSPAPFAASTTVKSLPPIRGPFALQNQHDLAESFGGFPAQTTFRPNDFFGGPLNKRQIDNKDAASTGSNVKDDKNNVDKKVEQISDDYYDDYYGYPSADKRSDNENSDGRYFDQAQIVIAEKLPK